MQIIYTKTFKDVIAAQRFYRRQKFSRQIKMFFWPFFTVLIICFCFYFYFTGNKGLLLLFSPFLALGLSVSMILFIFHPLGWLRSYEREFPPTRTDCNTIININDDHILVEIPGVGVTKIYWNEITDFIQNESIVILCVGSDRFLSIPVRAMSPSQHAELNDLVVSNLVRKP